MKYYLLAFKKYADFKGRATRPEYWYFVLFNILIGYGLLGLGYALSGEMGGIFYLLYMLASIIPSIAVGVRRMHDVGKSGWFLLVPIYNIILAITESEPSTNKWGNPQSN